MTGAADGLDRDAQLQELIDHHAIRKMLASYCFATDRCDEPRIAEVYAEESWDDHGDRSATGPEFAKLIARDIDTTTESLSHMLGQSQITVDGDKAGAETYFLAVATWHRDDGVEMCNQLGGRFVDRLIRTEKGWVIEHRIAVRDWAISLPVEADWTAQNSLKRGLREGQDPAYAVLGMDWPAR